MNVARNTLAAGNGKCKLVRDRMAGTVLGDRRVRREARAAVAEAGVGTRMDRGAVVRIDHVTSAATARPVIAGVIVGAQEIQGGVQQAGLLQAEKNGVGPILGAKSAIAQTGLRATRDFFRFGNARFGAEPSAALENAEDVAGLRDLEPRQRIEQWQHRMAVHLLLRRRRHVLYPLRRAVHAVALAVVRRLVGDRAVVVKRGARSMQPWVIMLLRTASVSRGWQPPQVAGATRKSPGLKKRMNSGDSWFSSVYERTGFPDGGQASGKQG